MREGDTELGPAGAALSFSLSLPPTCPRLPCAPSIPEPQVSACTCAFSTSCPTKGPARTFSCSHPLSDRVSQTWGLVACLPGPLGPRYLLHRARVRLEHSRRSPFKEAAAAKRITKQLSITQGLPFAHAWQDSGALIELGLWGAKQKPSLCSVASAPQGW